MTGRHLRHDLPGLLLGELPPATTVAVDRHLSGCDPCRRDLAAVAIASSALRDASRLEFPAADLPPPPWPPALPAERAELPGPPLPAAVLGDRRRRGRRGRRLLGAAAVVAALALGVGGLALGRDGDAGRGQTVALAAPAVGGPSAQARMRGAGDDQVMTITARDLPRPPAGTWYEVWLVGDAGEAFPVGVLAPDGEGIWSLPADVAARYRAIDVTLEPADGDPSHSGRSVLRGSYA
jgi:anti-sigma factor RsiW